MEFEGFTYLKFVLALVFVLGLIGVLAVVAKRIGLGNRGPVRHGRDRRLNVVEALPLDAKRRVVLVRRDATEHLVLLGASGETVIETGIAAPPAPTTAEPPAPVADRPLRGSR